MRKANLEGHKINTKIFNFESERYEWREVTKNYKIGERIGRDLLILWIENNKGGFYKDHNLDSLVSKWVIFANNSLKRGMYEDLIKSYIEPIKVVDKSK